MQEEVENRAVVLAVRTARLTGEVLKDAVSKYLAYRKEKSLKNESVRPAGRQTVKELVGQDQGVSNIEITEKNIKGFERVARKYGVDYAVRKKETGDVPKYLVFFKARDADALTAAFTEYTRKTEKKNEKRPLRRHTVDQERARDVKRLERVRSRERGLER